MNKKYKDVEVLTEALLGKGCQIKKVCGNDEYLEVELSNGWELLQEFSKIELKKNKQIEEFGVFVVGLDVVDGKIVEREILLDSKPTEEEAVERVEFIMKKFDDGEKFEFDKHIQVIDGFGVKKIEK